MTGFRSYLFVTGLLLNQFLFSSCSRELDPSAEPDAERRPNILLVLADDLGYADLSCYGSTLVRTPNLDALAASGVRFTDFHSNGPMCSPTRAALLTGRYQQRSGIEGVLGFRRDSDAYLGMASSEVTFAEVLKEAGYVTGIFGKWHTGHLPRFAPTRQGFDAFRGLYGGIDYHSHFNRIGQENWWKDEELAPEEGYATTLITSHAVRFIEQHKDQPFCLYVPHFAVHFPWQGPEDQADFARDLDCSSPEKKYGGRSDRKSAYREMIEALDESIGRLIQALKRTNLERKTLVFFASDNGGHHLVTNNVPLRSHKGSLFEGGHRVPAIAYWPTRIRPGAVSEQVVMTTDLFPTLVELAGTSVPEELKLDGISLAGLLLRGERIPDRTLFWRHRGDWAVRSGPWKLLSTEGTLQLFNLADDLGEQTDLSSSHPQIVRTLKGEYQQWEQETTAGVDWVQQ